MPSTDSRTIAVRCWDAKLRAYRMRAVTVTVDFAAIGERLGARVFKRKSGVVERIYGAVEVTRAAIEGEG